MTDASYLPLVEQIREAAHNRDRAALLLKLPDFTFCTYGGQLQAVLAEAQFKAGARFAQLREMAMHTPRDAEGRMRGDVGTELEHWRATMSRYAAGEPVETLSRDLAGATYSSIRMENSNG